MAKQRTCKRYVKAAGQASHQEQLEEDDDEERKRRNVDLIIHHILGRLYNFIITSLPSLNRNGFMPSFVVYRGTALQVVLCTLPGQQTYNSIYSGWYAGMSVIFSPLHSLMDVTY